MHKSRLRGLELFDLKSSFWILLAVPFGVKEFTDCDCQDCGIFTAPLARGRWLHLWVDMESDNPDAFLRCRHACKTYTYIYIYRIYIYISIYYILHLVASFHEF